MKMNYEGFKVYFNLESSPETTFIIFWVNRNGIIDNIEVDDGVSHRSVEAVEVTKEGEPVIYEALQFVKKKFRSVIK